VKQPVRLLEWQESEEPLQEPKADQYGRIIDKINNKHYFGKGKDVVTLQRNLKIRAYNYVGVLQIKDLRIQILPKICNEGDNEEQKRACALENMFFLLSFTRDLEIRKLNTAFFAKCNDDFFEVLIRLFLQELDEVCKYLIPLDYVLKEDNLTFFRGKLVFNEHIKNNEAKKNRDKIFCQFDELLLDNLLNQTVRYTLKLLKTVSRNASNQGKIKKLATIYSDVSDKRIFPEDEDRIKFNKNNEAYRSIIKKCFMFIRDLTVSFKEGKAEYFALLFDMNELFEKFIARLIIRKKEVIGVRDLEPSAQEYIGYLAQNKAGDDYVHLKPDVVFRNNRNQVELILDTKYKRLTNERGVSNPDVYQMLAYGIRAPCNKIILLYPRGESKEDELYIDKLNLGEQEEQKNLDKIRIFVRTINLLVKDLKKETRSDDGLIIKQLKGIFNNVLAPRERC
jgi:5-methylcytosine-specific restriction enzyme subunit McrC